VWPLALDSHTRHVRARAARRDEPMRRSGGARARQKRCYGDGMLPPQLSLIVVSAAAAAAAAAASSSTGGSSGGGGGAAAGGSSSHHHRHHQQQQQQDQQQQQLLQLGAGSDDPRHILAGTTIADSKPYYDQPQIVRHPSGVWVCVLTGAAKEGDPEENVYVTRSTNSGRSWDAPRAIEPHRVGGPPAAWVNPIMTRSGRIYAYYTYNTRNLTHLPGSKHVRDRTDMLGQQVFRYSDDVGVTFSSQRFTIPIATKSIDVHNEFNGSVHEGWGVGKPIIQNGVVHTQFAKRLCASPKDATPRCGDADPRNRGSKLRQYTPMQAFLVSSDNIDTEADPTKIKWTTSPSGPEGLRAQRGELAEEGDVVQLGHDDLVYLFRTYDGYVGVATRIGGVWKDKQRALRLHDGTALKNPNGPIAPRRFVDDDGSVHYLLLFYNRGLPGKSGSNTSSNSAWGSRNPYWLACGWSDASNTTIYWSEPEVVLYSHTATDRIGYPDLFYGEAWSNDHVANSSQSLYMTETNKEVARLHVISPILVDGLKGQRHNKKRPESPTWISNCTTRNTKQTLPFALPNLHHNKSISFEVWAAINAIETSTSHSTIQLLHCRGDGSVAAANNTGIGLTVATLGNETVAFASFGDGEQEGAVPPGADSLRLRHRESVTRCIVNATRATTGQLHHFGLVIDGAAKLALLTVDGVLCDGGDAQEASQGFWFGLDSTMRSLAGGAGLSSFCDIRKPHFTAIRSYGRALRVSELVGGWNAGPWELPSP
jgi:hypothetical protein